MSDTLTSDQPTPDPAPQPARGGLPAEKTVPLDLTTPPQHGPRLGGPTRTRELMRRLGW